jgi:hypothetical protein
MAYRCLDCGHIFEEGEQAEWVEMHGFRGGGGEHFSGCPLCHGEYQETVRCEVCGAEHLEDELNGGVCDECIDEYRKDFSACLKISRSEGEKETIKINALIATLLDDGDIEQILIEHIKERMPDVDCSAYIDNDISEFGEKLAKECA